MISTKGRYALRVMLDLAEHESAGFIPLKDVAERQEISKKYLEIIVRELVAANFVVGISGKGGGYRLCRSAEDYTVGEILERMEGTLATVACLSAGAPLCPRTGSCETLPLWAEYDKLTHDFFYGKRLSDLTGHGQAAHGGA
ncbi:MAG: Rrf2 family transcriptional regulator [Oscillospiraceae bacterium]|nr:Rrf2 family transcriptional regulator [Oscillospiraceae bacterium]